MCMCVHTCVLVCIYMRVCVQHGVLGGLAGVQDSMDSKNLKLCPFQATTSMQCVYVCVCVHVCLCVCV